MSEQISKKTILDYTTIITVCGVLLYQLGWLYWEQYFRILNINSSFIDIPFEKIISTTWMKVGFIIIVFHRAIEFIYKETEDFQVTEVIYLIVLALALLLIIDSPEDALLIFSISLGIIIIASITKVRNFLGSISIRQFTYVIAVVMYFVSFIYYIGKANEDAKEILRAKNDIVLYLNHDNQKVTGKFITFMNDKYFLLTTNKKNKKKVTVVLNDSEIHHAMFLNK